MVCLVDESVVYSAKDTPVLHVAKDASERLAKILHSVIRLLQVSSDGLDGAGRRRALGTVAALLHAAGKKLIE